MGTEPGQKKTQHFKETTLLPGKKPTKPALSNDMQSSAWVLCAVDVHMVQAEWYGKTGCSWLTFGSSLAQLGPLGLSFYFRWLPLFRCLLGGAAVIVILVDHARVTERNRIPKGFTESSKKKEKQSDLWFCRILWASLT